MSLRRSIVSLSVALVLLWAGHVPVQAADTAAVAKELVKKYADSVVSVTGTMKMTMSMQGLNMPARETKFETTGVIIDPSGLTVLANSSIDSDDILNSITQGIPGGDGDAAKMKIKTEFSALKLRLSDGTETPVKIVLTDKDLDLAFVMPDSGSAGSKTTAAKYPALKFDSGATADLLDEVIFMDRLPKNLGRQPSVQLGRISAVVSKPRTFYTVADTAGMGTPVFTADGRVLGIQVIRKDPAGSNANAEPSMQPVIVPAGDVAEIAKQALTKAGK